jgi:hypothetical protein
MMTGESYESGDVAFGTAWEGVLVVEGVETGDGRQFALNSVSWPDPVGTVIPLRRNIEDSHGGEPKTTAVLVGRITNIWRDEANPAIIRGSGVFDDNGSQGAEALRLVREGFLAGISIDPDNIKNADIEMVFPDESGNEDPMLDLFAPPDLTIFHAGRLRAATLVEIPAFVESQIWITADTPTVNDAAVVASTWTKAAWNGGMQERNVSSALVPSVFAHVGRDQTSSRFLHHEIVDGRPGPASLAAVSASMRALLTGRVDGLTWSEQRTAYEHLASHMHDAGHKTPNFSPDVDVTQAGLVAALEQLAGPPEAWFATPEPGHYQPLVVSDETTPNGWRKFYGHGAGWGTCHTGYSNVCKQPPREGDHTYFRTGEIVTAEGNRIAVGSVTMGIGHAPTVGISAHAAVEHYDNTGSVVALVASSEGQHGIWLAGAIPPWVSAERVAQLQASGQVSGDWRRIGNKLRLMAFLVVNHPGFPLPRLNVRAGVMAGVQTSLVAAIGPSVPGSGAGQERTVSQQRAMDAIASRIGRDTRTRAAELRARVHGK